MNLQDKISSRFKGVMAIGDLHSQYLSLVAAIEYAQSNDLFLLSMGDLVDHEGYGYPYEVVSALQKQLDRNAVALVVGNHDDKMYRYAKGNPILLGKDQLTTMSFVGPAREEAFLRMYQEVVTHRNASYHFRYGRNTMFVHAATHRTIWEYSDTLSKMQKARALYGEVDGTRDDRGFPNRTYKWTDDVPNGKLAVVGHDRRPLGKELNETLIYKNAKGGSVIFTDTSCGKGGHLTGAIFSFAGGELEFESFNSFEEHI